MKRIVLTVHEAVTPAMVGMRRQLYALSRTLRDHGTGDDTAFDHHIFGAMAEFAVARALNMFWAPNVGKMDGGDVGCGLVECRMRLVPGTGTDLAIRPDDNDDKPFVLVHCRRTLAFDLIGWLYGGEGKARGPFNEKSKVWFAPPPYRPVEELVDLFGFKQPDSP